MSAGMSVSPYWFEAGEGERHLQQGDQRYMLKASAQSTGSGFSLFEVESRRGSAPPMHMHRKEDEAFYILDGEIRVRVGDRDLEARPGTWIYAPRDVPHGYVVRSLTARHLSFAFPAGFEHFLEAVQTAHQSAAEEPPLERMVELAQQYGISIMGPPLTL
jgi:quercetin dioxygenase-like cupin family protein